jgi:hypothetical protein
LSGMLPQLTSTREFLTDEKWMGKIPVTLIGSKERLENLQPKEKVTIAENLLRTIKNDLSTKIQNFLYLTKKKQPGIADFAYLFC